MAELTTTSARNLLREIHRRRVQHGLSRTSLALWILASLAGGMILLPLAYLVTRLAGAPASVWDLLFQVRTLETLVRTFSLAITVTVASAALAVPLAWLTTRTDLPLRRIWGVLTVLPLVIPSYVGAYLFVASLGPQGVLAQGLAGLVGDLPIPSIYGFSGAAYILTLLSYPYTLLSLRVALQGLDPALEEASRSLGYGPWRTFWQVSWPQLRPGLAAGSLLVALYVLRDFGAVAIMRYNTFTRVLYIQYQTAFDRSGAAALALVLVALTMGVLVLEVRTRGRGSYQRAVAGGRRPPPAIHLGAWRWPALAFCAAVVTLALFIPAGVLAYWLIRGWLAGERLAPLWLATRNSLGVSALAAAFCLLVAIPVAFVSVRRPGRFSLLLERLTYAGYALPGIVVALALVFFGANFARPLYQTLPLLLLAYGILFLPQAVGAWRTSLLQIHPHLEDAARGLGHRPLAVFTRINLPLLGPGAAAGASLVFLTVMKELPATLILGPFGFKTLATSVWSAVSEAFFAQAAGPALLLVLASSLPTAILLLRERS